jgi:hypothetical protein
VLVSDASWTFRVLVKGMPLDWSGLPIANGWLCFNDQHVSLFYRE